MTTFEEIMKSQFYNKTAWYVDMFGKIKSNKTTLYADRNNCASQKQIDKWLCINDLLNIATYFNQNWTPDWDNHEEEKFEIVVNNIQNKTYAVAKITDKISGIVIFKCQTDAQQAIDLLGKEKLEFIFFK